MANCFWLLEAQEKKSENKRPKKETENPQLKEI